MTTKVYLGVGSNLNRDNALRFAKKELSALFSILNTFCQRDKAK